MKPIESFELHLSYCLEKFKSKLPVNYKKAITNYLCEIANQGIKLLFFFIKKLEFHELKCYFFFHNY